MGDTIETSGATSTRVSEDELLGHLAEAARERSRAEAAHGAEWDRLTDEIVAAHGDTPFGADFRAGVRQRLRQAAEESDGVSAAFDEPAAHLPRWLPLAAGVLVAGALAFVVGPELLRRAKTDPTVDVLPRYSLEAEGVDDVRGPGDGPTAEASTTEAVVAVPGLRFRVVLRPESAPSSTVTARLFLEAADGDAASHGNLLRWTAAEAYLRVGEQGVVRLEDPPAETWSGLAPGLYRLHVAVGPADALPEGLAEPAADAAGWQLLSGTMVRVEAP